MLMESVMDFSAERSSAASSPRGDASPASKPRDGSPAVSPPRDAPNNNNNNKDMDGPMALIQQAGPHMGGHGGPHGPHAHPMAPPHPMGAMRHLGPPGLGLFNSLMGSPLEFMAAAQAQAQAQAHQHGHQGHAAGHPGHPGGLSHPGNAGGHPHQGGHPPRSYNSPPPISSSDPTANECKLVTYRGQKVAAFMISGETMLCLPQAFELFLKHLVGGLHTVYTKLKRLDIVPLVCNVEQVRILRGLGAIQPGVNRCKLLSCKDFDTLYRDCTTARCLMSQRAPPDSRAGRPTKRMPLGLGLPAGLQGHPAGLQGHPQLKKHRLENGDFTPFENGHLSGADKSPLLANGYNAPPSHLQAMQQLYQHPLMSPGLPPLPPQAGGGGGGAGGQAHPSLQPPLPPGAAKPPAGIPAMEAITNWENCRAAYEEIVKNLERIQQERGDGEGAEGRPRDLTSHNGSPNGHSPVLNLSKGGGGGGSAGGPGGPGSAPGSRGSGAGSAVSGAASDSDPGASDKDDDEDDAVSNPEDDDEPRPTDLTDGHGPRLGSSPMAASPPPYGATASMGAAAVGSAATESPSDEEGGGGSSGASGGGGGALGTMALLRNIQRLLKVAAENARAQERQVHMDRAELKMDVLRERELKESLERQLVDETRTRMLWQKRLQKERKARRRLQEQLELEMKRRAQLEDALRGAVGNDARESDGDRKDESQERQAVHGSPPPPHGHPQQPQPPQQPPPQHHRQSPHKHPQTSPLPDRERQSPAILDSRANFFKNSVLFGGAS